MIDDDGFIASVEQRAVRFAHAIMALRSDTIEPPHGTRELGQRCARQSMVVVVHAAPGMALDAVALMDFAAHIKAAMTLQVDGELMPRPAPRFMR